MNRHGPSRRPGWVTVLAFFVLLGAALNLIQSLLALVDAPLVLGLSLMLDTLIAAAAVGLWQMKKWGVVFFLLSALASLIYFVLYTVLPGHAQLPASGFWFVVIAGLALYGLVIYGLRRLWLRGALR